MTNFFCSSIIVAAGSGKRMGSSVAKQFLPLDGVPILFHTLAKFQCHPLIHEIILVLSPSMISDVQEEIQEQFPKVTLVAGGDERQDSVYQGLLHTHPQSSIVLIHDGVRPFASSGLIDSVIHKTLEKKACIPVVPVKDTIKVAAQDTIVKTLDRQALVSVQTPQGFSKTLLLACYEKTIGSTVTDDASLVEQAGYPVYTVEGEYTNIKITTKEDLLFASVLLKENNSNI